MKHKNLLLPAGFLLMPIIVIVAVVLAGNVIPIGTFNHEERQRLEVVQSSQTKKTNARLPTRDSEIVKGPNIAELTSAGTVRVNNFA